jgi:hypothetical protein
MDPIVKVDGPAAKGFSIIDPGEKVTIYSVRKKTKFLNHHTQELEFAGKKIPVADQEQMKEMYEADVTYAKFIKPPPGHVAPWANKK